MPTWIMQIIRKSKIEQQINEAAQPQHSDGCGGGG